MDIFKSAYILVCVISFVKNEDVCWSTFGNYQYRITTEAGGRTFDEAIGLCLNDGTTLTSIHSQEENDFINEFVMAQISVPVWIGLRRYMDNLTWIDGSQLDYVDPTYRRKIRTESCFYIFQCYTSESCVYIFQGWIDESCEHGNLYFICKREINANGSCTTTTIEPSSTESMTETTTFGQKTTSRDIEDVTPVYENVTDNVLTTQSKEISSEVIDVESTTGTPKTDVASYSNAPSNNDTTTTEKEMTFEERLEEMTVKKKPVYPIVEGKNSKAIGSVSIMILAGLILGVVMLDLSTIRKHVKLFKSNTKGITCCKRKNAKTVSLQMIEMSMRNSCSNDKC